jgi:hypothetical protein
MVSTTPTFSSNLLLSALLQVCQGTGVQVHLRPLGPGMMQQIQSKCGSCAGTGYSTPPSKLLLVAIGRVIENQHTGLRGMH